MIRAHDSSMRYREFKSVRPVVSLVVDLRSTVSPTQGNSTPLEKSFICRVVCHLFQIVKKQKAQRHKALPSCGSVFKAKAVDEKMTHKKMCRVASAIGNFFFCFMFCYALLIDQSVE